MSTTPTPARPRRPDARPAPLDTSDLVTLPEPGRDPIGPLVAAWRGATHDTRKRFCREIRHWFAIYETEGR